MRPSRVIVTSLPSNCSMLIFICALAFRVGCAPDESSIEIQVLTGRAARLALYRRMAFFALPGIALAPLGRSMPGAAFRGDPELQSHAHRCQFPDDLQVSRLRFHDRAY